MNQVINENTKVGPGWLKRLLSTIGTKIFDLLVEMGQNTADSHIYMNYTAGPMDMPQMGESLVRSKKL